MLRAVENHPEPLEKLPTELGVWDHCITVYPSVPFGGCEGSYKIAVNVVVGDPSSVKVDGERFIH